MTARTAAVVGTVVFAVLILVMTTIGVLIGLNAECNSGPPVCPRSTAFRVTLISDPILVLVILVAGGVVSIRRRTPVPLLMTCAGVVVLNFVVGSLVNL